MYLQRLYPNFNGKGMNRPTILYQNNLFRMTFNLRLLRDTNRTKTKRIRYITRIKRLSLRALLLRLLSTIRVISMKQRGTL